MQIDSSLLPSWAPADDRLCINNNGQIQIINLYDFQRLTIGKGNFPKWHPLFDEVLYDYYDYSKMEGTIWIFDISTKSNYRLNIDGGAMPSWSANGNQIVYSLNTETKIVLFIINKDGTKKTQLTN